MEDTQLTTVLVPASLYSAFDYWVRTTLRDRVISYSKARGAAATDKYLYKYCGRLEHVQGYRNGTEVHYIDNPRGAEAYAAMLGELHILIRVGHYKQHTFE